MKKWGTLALVTGVLSVVAGILLVMFGAKDAIGLVFAGIGCFIFRSVCEWMEDIRDHLTAIHENQKRIAARETRRYQNEEESGVSGADAVRAFVESGNTQDKGNVRRDEEHHWVSGE